RRQTRADVGRQAARRVRSVRNLRPWRRCRSADVLRPLRTPAPRAGERRYRNRRRDPGRDPNPARPRIPGVRRERPPGSARAYRGRPRTVLDGGLLRGLQRRTYRCPERHRRYRRRPQRQPHQRLCQATRAGRPGRAVRYRYRQRGAGAPHRPRARPRSRRQGPQRDAEARRRLQPRRDDPGSNPGGPRSNGRPPVVPRPPRAQLGHRIRELRADDHRRHVRARGRAGRDRRSLGRRPSLARDRADRAPRHVLVRADLFRPPGQPHPRATPAPGAAADGSPTGEGIAGGRGYRRRSAGLGYPSRDRVRARIRHPVPGSSYQEPLHRADVHPAGSTAARGRRLPQVQCVAGGVGRETGGAGGRHDRPRHHQPPHHPTPSQCRREGGPHAGPRPADE
ncbi:MAG: Amidophosphoribosyltransferase, partial [uncultured Thermomicrobiales bacterium]